MKTNVGTIDRILRATTGLALLAASVFAPPAVPLAVRIAALGGGGIYMLFTALAGTCFGYTLMGKSTCPVRLRDQ